jgi:sugar lactone lactonase YvrE
VTAFVAHPASSVSCKLGEGPLWDADRRRVLWVDILRGEVLEGTLDDDKVILAGLRSFDGMVGAVVADAQGRLLVAGQESLIVEETDGSRVVGPRIVPEGVDSRTNDGAVDPQGRFLIGTLALDDRRDQERLVRVDDERLTLIDDDLGLSNGLAWSPDGSLFYSVDTAAQTIWVRDYDGPSGTVGERREHLVLDSGHPDGICIDSEGGLWVAVWGAGEVRHFSPAGELLDTVSVAAPHTSSVAFVGPDLDLLLITTAQKDLTDEQLAEWPDSGRLFAVRVGVTGLPLTSWSGKPRPASSPFPA